MKNDLITTSNNFSTALLLESLHQKGNEITFEDVYRGIWLPKKQATISSWFVEARRIENVLLPAIGSVPVKDITPKMIFPYLQKYENKLPTLQRLVMRVNEIMNFAVCADLVDRNRCASMKIIYPHQKSEHLATIPANDLPHFFYVLNTNDGKPQMPQWFKLFVLFHLYSMGRCNEVASLKWKYIKGDTITIPASEMKGRREHRIWLCPDMIELLKKVHLMTKDRKNEYVFNFMRSKEGHVHRQFFAKWLWQSSLKGKLTPHGLRSTARTWLRDQGCPNEVGEDFLAHVHGSPTERSYIRGDYLEQRKEWYVKWFEFLRYCWVLSAKYDNAYITKEHRSDLDILINANG